MRSWFYAFFMAWGMFLAIPCPFPKWDENARGRMLSCLPLIGIIIGGLWALAAWGLSFAGLPSALNALLLFALPWLLTGFIHLDGFMDVCDAIMSRRDLETRQKILKDPHCGSFAVISLALLLAASWAVMTGFEFSVEKLLPLALIPIASRASASIAVLTLKPMKTSQYAKLEKERPFGLLILPLLLLLASSSIPAAFYGIHGIAPVVCAAAYWLFAAVGSKSLGGMNGDVSGFALTLGEFAGIAVLALVR